MPVGFKSINPKEFSSEAFDILFEAVEETIDEADNDFAKTYQTFQHKPSFIKEFAKAKGEGKITTTGDGSTTNPYPFLVRGTSVRYATMTPDFSPKTKPRIIGSGGGSGGLLYVDKRRPRPGIKAREFDKEIKSKQKPKFIKRANKKVKIAAKKSGHSI